MEVRNRTEQKPGGVNGSAHLALALCLAVGTVGACGDLPLDLPAEAIDGALADPPGMAAAASAQANNAPVFSPSSVTVHVYDYTPGGSAFWEPLTATDADGDSLTYSLTGTDASSFSIGSGSAQLSLASGTSLDADTKSSYSINVVASDDAATATLALTVDVRKCGGGDGIWCATMTAASLGSDGYGYEAGTPDRGKILPSTSFNDGTTNRDVSTIVYYNVSPLELHFYIDPASANSTLFDEYGLEVDGHLFAFTEAGWDNSSLFWYWETIPTGFDVAAGNDYSVAIVPAAPGKAPNPRLAGAGRDRLILEWDMPSDARLYSPDKGRNKWQWTDDDPSSTPVVWQTLNDIDCAVTEWDQTILESVCAEGDNTQYGHATGLTTGERYDVWIRAKVGEGADALYGAPSDSTAGGTTRAHVPELWCAAAAEYEKMYTGDPNNPFDFDNPPDYTLVRECPESLSVTQQESSPRIISPFDAAPVLWNDYDWDGDNIAWSLEAVEPDEQEVLEDIFQMSGNGALGKRSIYDRMDYESNPVWTFYVIGRDNREGADSILVTVNLADKDEPPPVWEKTYPFTVLRTLEDGTVILRGDLPDMRWKPPIDTYEVRYCKTSPGPCDDNNAAHWSETEFDASTHAIQTPPSSVSTNTDALEHPTVELRITGLEQGAEYKLRVRARNHEGVNPWTLGITVTTGQPLSFGGATIKDKLYTTGQQIMVTLPEAVGPNPPFTYVLMPVAGLPSGLTFDGATRELRGTIDASQGAVEYTYGATDAVGDQVALRFDIAVQPARPVVRQTSPGDKRMTLFWDDPMDAGIDGWQVSVDNGDWMDLSAVEDDYSGSAVLVGTVTGLDNGTIYGFRIRAVAVTGVAVIHSTPSHNVSRAPTANILPEITNISPMRISLSEATPRGTDVGDPVNATDANDDAITWRLGGADAALFGIRNSGRTTGQIYTVGLFDFETDEHHTFTVTANDGFGDSNVLTVNVRVLDETRERRFPGTPDAPSVSSASNTSLNVSWVKPNVANVPDVESYDVRYCRTSSNCDHKQDDPTHVGADWTDAGHTGTATSMVIGGLQQGVEYEVNVRARNINGPGPWSEPGFGTPEGKLPPGKLLAPSAPTVTAPTTNSLRIEWTKPGSTGGPVAITHYRIAYRSLEQGAAWIYRDVAGTVTSATVGVGVFRGTAYMVRVRAENNDFDPPVWSPYSEPGYAQTPP